MDASRTRRRLLVLAAVVLLSLLAGYFLRCRPSGVTSRTSSDARPSDLRPSAAPLWRSRVPPGSSDEPPELAIADEPLGVWIHVEPGLSLEYRFTANVRAADDERMIQCDWDFGDGTAESRHEPSVLHSFAAKVHDPTDQQEFRFQVRATVTTESGLQASATTMVEIYSDVGYLAKQGIHAVEVVPTVLVFERDERNWATRVIARNESDVSIRILGLDVTFAPLPEGTKQTSMSLSWPGAGTLDPKGTVDTWLRIADAQVPATATTAVFRVRARSGDGGPVVFSWDAQLQTQQREATKPWSPPDARR